jgi:hypothetical protein
VISVCQSPEVNRSARRAELLKTSTRARSAVESRQTPKVAERTMTSCTEAFLLTQTSSVGGLVLTELIAVAISPARWPASVLVISATPDANLRIPDLKQSARAVWSRGGEACSMVPMTASPLMHLAFASSRQYRWRFSFRRP